MKTVRKDQPTKPRGILLSEIAAGIEFVVIRDGVVREDELGVVLVSTASDRLNSTPVFWFTGNVRETQENYENGVRVLPINATLEWDVAK